MFYSTAAAGNRGGGLVSAPVVRQIQVGAEVTRL